MKVFILDSGIDLTNYINALSIIDATPIISKDISLSINSDALLLTGGGDIHPFFVKTYGNLKNVNISRDVLEHALISSFVNTNRKIVGICKGLQFINGYFNGTLEEVNNHEGITDVYHDITATGCSFLKKLNLKTVNSNHRLRIRTLGKHLKITAFSSDLTIEAIAHQTLPIRATQFHPERLDKDLVKSLFQTLFE